MFHHFQLKISSFIFFFHKQDFFPESWTKISIIPRGASMCLNLFLDCLLFIIINFGFKTDFTENQVFLRFGVTPPRPVFCTTQVPTITFFDKVQSYILCIELHNVMIGLLSLLTYFTIWNKWITKMIAKLMKTCILKDPLASTAGVNSHFVTTITLCNILLILS